MKLAKVSIALIIAGTALVQVTAWAQDGKGSDQERTVFGAIKAGNKDGSIPPYTGGLPVTTAPPGFVKDSGSWPDPFANEKPLYSITAKNMNQYADKLSESTKVLLSRFPNTYRIDVYPTHRTVSYPKFFLENTAKNATRCTLIEGGLAIKGCYGGMPFPNAKNGYEMMWNSILAFRKPIIGRFEAVYIDANGNAVESNKRDGFSDMPYFDPKGSLDTFEATRPIALRALGAFTSPPRIAGDATLVKYSTNPVKNSNQGWTYQQGNRRVRVIPDAQYDFPLMVSAGAQFFDELYVFSGKMDRFDFKLIGTKEMLMPYNTQRTVHASKKMLTAAGGGKHPNPDTMRWELHRVNIVEATLKPGFRHAAAKRRYYIDEDFPGTAMVDAWDSAGKPFKGVYPLSYSAYDKQQTMQQSSLIIDLTTGIQYYFGQLADPGAYAKVLDAAIPDADMTPEGLARRSSR